MIERVIGNSMFVYVAVALLIAARPVAAQDAVEEGRDALGDTTEFPWYDAENDTLRPVNLAEPDEPEPEEEPVSDPDFDPASADLSGGGAMSGLAQALFWILIIAAFGALVALLVWAFLRYEGKDKENGEGTEVVESSSDVDRIEQLPFEVRQPKGDLLEEARRCYEAGDLREAIIYLYSYKLVQLDKHHFIHLAKGKTNRQYLREVRPQPRVVPLLERTMVAFEDVFFGDHNLERNQFEKCWNGLSEFHQVVQGGVA